MVLPVPRRKLRPAPDATCSFGGTPVPVRRLPRRPVFKEHATVDAPLPDRVLDAVKLVRRCGASAAISVEEVGSARLGEERERKQLAILWLACAKQVAAHSESLRLLDDPQPEQLLPLFLDRAVSTLKRHLVGWRAWSNFCVTLGWSAGSPSLQQLLDFLQCLVDGSRSDRGPARRRSALGVLSAMTFAAHKLSLSCLLNLLEQLVLAWKRADCRKRTRTKEAVPLPFVVVKAFEAALPSACQEDRWFFVCIVSHGLGIFALERFAASGLEFCYCNAGSIDGLVLADQKLQDRDAIRFPTLWFPRSGLGTWCPLWPGRDSCPP